MVIVLLLVMCSSYVAYVFFVWFGEVTRDALFCLLVRWLVMPCLFFFGPVAMAALYFLFIWSGGFCCPVFCLLGTVALDALFFVC